MTQLNPPVRLDELIDGIKKAHHEPLEQLSGAVIVADAIGDIADHLIGYFVDQARRSGASWSDIGRSMGVTKQAAQKRFVPKPSEAAMDPNAGFGKFTDDARAVVVEAQNAARTAHNGHIVPAHLVLGLVTVAEPSVVHVLQAQGADVDAVRTAALTALPAAVDPAPELVPFDGAAKKVLELTFRSALRLGDDEVASRHILLAALEEEAGDGVLSGLGVGAEATERAFTR